MITRLLLATALGSAALCCPTPAWASTPGEAPRAGGGTMTQAEYRRLEKGMTLDRIRKVAGARGHANSGSETCRSLQFHGHVDPPGTYQYSVLLERSHGAFRLTDKADDGNFFLCPVGA